MGRSCSVTVRTCARGCVVRVTGRGTMRESASVRDFIMGAIADGANVVLDLSECEYLDSTFLGCLVLLHNRGTLQNQGAQRSFPFFVLADASARQRLLGEMRLDRLLQFADSPPVCDGPSVPLPDADVPRSEFGRHVLETHRRLAELGGPEADRFRRIAENLAKELDENN